MDVLLVQPPFVQLNAPYPAVAYLASFLRRRGHRAHVLDLSIELFHRVFCRAGLSTIFGEAERRLAGRLPALEARIRANVVRYLSNAPRYVETIEQVVGLLTGGDEALAHALTTTGRVPWGHRVEGFLEANEGTVGAADAPILASLLVEDLADFIRFAVDPEFSLVRYAESKAASQPDFAVVEAAARDSWLFSTFLPPLVEESLARLPRPELVCVTVPFPGTLPGALAFAAEAKRLKGPGLPIAFGGGYVSTELRALRDTGILAYADYLCFDAGFAALAALVDHAGSGSGDLYRTITREGGRLVAHGFDGDDLARFSADALYETRSPARPEQLRAIDEEAIRTVFPDFAGLDFSRYACIVEGTNPMHALWSDTKWLKARLAHGCYWKRCAFCDTSLEYIARFSPSSPEALFDAMLAQARATGQHGIHFVDEAMPVPHLLRFALANIAAGRPLASWGNARLERQLTPDACAVLAEGGLLGVSAGLEIATEGGLESTRKGIGLVDAVGALTSMKANGILTHVYLIYGWPGQDEQELVDSMETVRQLFAAGLVDSAFWHKFILTRHSPIYREWKAGARPGLRVIEQAWTFGSNDLSFVGEELLARFGPGLDAALGAWMQAEEIERPPSAWFPFRVPKTTVPADRVERLARAARRAVDARPAGRGKRAAWLGGALVQEPAREGSVRLSWSYRNTVHAVVMDPGPARTLIACLQEARTMDEILERMNGGDAPAFESTPAFRRLRRAGLAAY